MGPRDRSTLGKIGRPCSPSCTAAPHLLAVARALEISKLLQRHLQSRCGEPWPKPAHWQTARLSGLRSLLSCVKLPCCLWFALQFGVVRCMLPKSAPRPRLGSQAPCSQARTNAAGDQQRWIGRKVGLAASRCRRPAACKCTTLPPSRICPSSL